MSSPTLLSPVQHRGFHGHDQRGMVARPAAARGRRARGKSGYAPRRRQIFDDGTPRSSSPVTVFRSHTRIPVLRAGRPGEPGDGE